MVTHILSLAPLDALGLESSWMKCPEPNSSTWLRGNIQQKDSVETDLVVDAGEILGRDDDRVSSASGTREAVDSRPGSNSNLGWSKNFQNDPHGEWRI